MFEALPPKMTRSKYLAQVFGSDHIFRYWQKNYVYKAFTDKVVDNFVLGVIAREHTVTISGPPQEQFAHKDVPDWDTANVFLDSSDHSDGQKLACQSVRGMGEPIALFRHLVDQINAENQSADWALSVNPITNEKDFWQIAKRYEGKIGELDLNFIAPNGEDRVKPRRRCVFCTRKTTRKRLRSDSEMPTKN